MRFKLTAFYAAAPVCSPSRAALMTDRYPGGPRVPAILRWPGRIPPWQVSAEVATTMDLHATILELVNLVSDSYERFDVADQPPEVVARLRDQMVGFARETGARLALAPWFRVPEVV